MTGPRIEEFYLGEPDLEAYYTEFPCSAMAIQPHLSNAWKRARVLEAHGYYRRPPRAGRKACFANFSPEEIDPISVRAVRSEVDRMQPEWVEEVRDATRLFNRADLIAGWCELPPQVVVAILENMKARGELSEG